MAPPPVGPESPDRSQYIIIVHYWLAHSSPCRPDFPNFFCPNFDPREWYAEGACGSPRMGGVRPLMARTSYLRVSLRSLFVAVALFAVLAAGAAACARRNDAMLRLLDETQFGYRPRVQEVVLRAPPLSGSTPLFANQSQAKSWLEQRPWWHRFVTWPVIEFANIVCERGATPDRAWESNKVPLLRELGIESVDVGRDGLTDDDMDWIARLNAKELDISDDGEQLTDATLKKLRKATSIKYLHISLKEFSPSAVTRLKDSRKWDSFAVDARANEK